VFKNNKTKPAQESLLRKTAPIIVLAILLAAFVFGITQLFTLRFGAGDVYPEYSSLRADPLGVKALYDSLESLRGITIRRNYQPPAKLRGKPGTTIFYLGAGVSDWTYVHESSIRDFETLAANGGRLVISFFPTNKKPSTSGWEGKDAPKKSEGKPAEKEGKKPSEPSQEKPKSPPPTKKNKRADGGDAAEKRIRWVSPAQRWGFNFGYVELPKKPEGGYESARAQRKDRENTNDAISWHTALVFDAPDPAWRVIYARDSHPVLIERPFGRGTIVLSADSYFLSNEALRRERHPELLAGLVGANTDVVFDEYHFDITEKPGVAALARKYRLHGLLAGLVLLAGLFIWKNAVRFVPPYQDDLSKERMDLVAGKDTAAGVVNLLRRSISPREILTVCLAEWKKSFVHDRKAASSKLERIQAVLDAENARPAKQRNPVASYQAIARILGERE
jgi:hypothetical protein